MALRKGDAGFSAQSTPTLYTLSRIQSATRRRSCGGGQERVQKEAPKMRGIEGLAAYLSKRSRVKQRLREPRFTQSGTPTCLVGGRYEKQRTERRSRRCIKGTGGESRGRGCGQEEERRAAKGKRKQKGSWSMELGQHPSHPRWQKESSRY